MQPNCHKRQQDGKHVSGLALSELRGTREAIKNSLHRQSMLIDLATEKTTAITGLRQAHHLGISRKSKWQSSDNANFWRVFVFNELQAPFSNMR